MKIPFIAFCIVTLSGCSEAQSFAQKTINREGKTIEQRFNPPKGFERQIAPINSFENYLRTRPLKPHGSQVLHYDGSIKNKKNVYCAVLNLDIGKQDLQQCADAVMRLRGEYLFAQKQWEKLGFEFTKDQHFHLFSTEAEDKSYKSFRHWMNNVFAYASTSSLHHQLQHKNIKDLSIGDVLIQTGRPYGHAVIVIDLAINNKTKERVFMLAQSYMPAQDIQVLINPNEAELSPWYSLTTIERSIETPEWTFTKNDLRTW